MNYFNIIHALCRSALSNPTSAITHQINRLIEALEKDGLTKEVHSLKSLLNSSQKGYEMAPSRIERSRNNFTGEILTQKVPLPLDKETSIPLAEIIFPEQLPDIPPKFSKALNEAVNAIVDEWLYFEDLKVIQANPVSSCLIYGAPGTGKTRLALWIGKKLGLPVVMAKLDGLMSSFLGTTSKNISALFNFASKYKCVLLLDEFDAIAKLRDDPQEVGEIKRVVNTLLQCLDARRDIGFTIGITNHELLLDPAIWRRFDTQVEIPKPSMEVLAEIIQEFMVPLELEDFEIKFLSWSIENSSGADAEMLVRYLKKSLIIGGKQSLIDQIRRYTILNSGRIENDKKEILISTDDEISHALISNSKFSFRQKEVASLIGVTQSTLSKMLAKK